MSGLGFFGNSILSIAGTAAIYVAAFKSPALLKELAKNPSLLSRELNLLYVGTRGGNRFLQMQRDSSHPQSTPTQQNNQSAQIAAHNAGQSLNQEA